MSQATTNEKPLSIEPYLPIEPPGWLLPITRRDKPKPRPEPRPFDYAACIAALPNFETTVGWPWWWPKERFLPAVLTPEEARFWLLALTRKGQKKRKNAPPPIPTEEECRSPLTRQEIVKAIQGCESPDRAVCQLLFSLLDLEDIVDILCKGELVPGYYTHNHNWLEHSLPGDFIVYAVPYLSDREIEALRGHVRKRLEAPPYSDPVSLLVAYLEMFPELERDVAAWHEERPRGYYGTHAHPVFNLATRELVEQHARRLKQWATLHQPELIHAWLYRTGLHALDRVRDAVLAAQSKGDAEMMLGALTPMVAVEIAPIMLELKLSSRAPALAARWLEEHPAHAIAGLLPVAASRGKLAEAALAYLRESKRKGFTDFLAQQLAQQPASGDRLRKELLEQEEKTYAAFTAGNTPDWLRAVLAESGKPAKSAKLPDWLRLTGLPPLVVGEHCFSDEQLLSLLAELKKSTLKESRPLVKAVKQNMAQPVLDEFAWRLFECWLDGGAPAKDKWAMFGLGLLGGNAVALKLAPLLRIMPGEGQHQRAVTGLECLRAIGTDSALIQLNSIAQKLRFAGLKNKAREMMDGIAADRGLTREQLEDRIVPDLDLDETGSRVFDFGPRQFQVVLDEDLNPRIRDANGKVKSDLPAATAGDDPEKSAAAIAEWKLLKKQLKEAIKVQVVRLEQAMVANRRWPVEEFESLLVRQPLMLNLVRRLIWAGHDEQGKLIRLFRVTEDRHYTDAEGTPCSLEGLAAISIPHLLHLGDEQLRQWRPVLFDFEIFPPFAQLDRAIHLLQADELDKVDLTRFAGATIPGPTLGGALEKAGWVRGVLHDHGDYHEYTRAFPTAGVNAVIEMEPGMMATFVSADEQRVPRVYFLPAGEGPGWGVNPERKVPLGRVDRVVISEVLADLERAAAKGTR